MKITIENTTDVVALPADLRRARVWTGTTENGTKVYLLIARVAVPADADNSAFERELEEHPARKLPDTFDLRHIL